MYIRKRTRGTNQHSVRGEIVGAKLCKKCGTIVSTRDIVMVNGFPTMQKNDICTNCGEKL